MKWHEPGHLAQSPSTPRRDKATGKTIAGLSVYSPCSTSTSTSTSTTDANGQIRCDYDSRWGFYDNWGYWHYGTLTALPKTAWETTWF